MQRLKNIIKYILILLSFIIATIFLMFLSCKIPKEKIYDNVRKSAIQLNEITDRGDKDLIEIYNKYIVNFHFTDILMINIAYSVDSEEAFESSLLARKNYNEATKTVELMPKDVEIDSKYEEELNAYSKELLGLIDNEVEEGYVYARYWHGYLIILRPLLVFFTYNTIRYIFIAITLILITLVFYKLFAEYDKKIAFLFLFSIIFVDALISAFCINTNICFIIALFASVIILYRKKLIKNYAIFFYIIAIITNILDLLTNPILTLGMPLIFYFMRYNIESDVNNSIKDKLIIFIKACISWSIGYFLFWFMKWIICDLFFDLNIITNAFSQIAYRSNKKNILIMKLIEKISLHINKWIFLIITILSVILLIVRRKNIANYIEYLAISLLPIIWMVVLMSHSIVHHFFTYRNLLIYVFSLLVMIVINIKQYKKGEENVTSNLS